MRERTLVLIKPDGVARGLVGSILHRFETIGLKIIALKMVHVDKEFAQHHYPVTTEWLGKVGTNSLTDCEKYGMKAREYFDTDNAVEIGKKLHVWNVDFLISGPVVALVLEGVHAIEVVRKMVGVTIPNLAAPGTIRGDFSSHSAISSNMRKKAIANLVHASGNKQEAEREIKLWFTERDLHTYKTVHDYF